MSTANLSSLETMRAHLAARKPSQVTPLEQILVDLDVYDGMEVKASDIERVVARVQAKLLAFISAPAGQVSGARTEVDYADPVVTAEPALIDDRPAFRLRISATRVA